MIESHFSIIAFIALFILALIGTYRVTYWLSGKLSRERPITQHEIAVERLVRAAAKAIPYVGEIEECIRPTMLAQAKDLKAELKQAIMGVTHEHWSEVYIRD